MREHLDFMDGSNFRAVSTTSSQQSSVGDGFSASVSAYYVEILLPSSCV